MLSKQMMHFAILEVVTSLDSVTRSVNESDRFKKFQIPRFGECPPSFTLRVTEWNCKARRAPIHTV